MNKSTNDPAGDCSRLVSRLDVGKRVTVNGHFGGVLKYVGKVATKEGIFAGVELDQPIGKHDGTHRNTVYFDCRPKHGIFAPTYKVKLENAESSDPHGNLDKPSNFFTSNNRRPNKLSKSAIPSLGQSPFANGNTMNVMDWSMMSTTSSVSQGNPMENSFISSTCSSGSNPKYNDFHGYGDIDDLMMNSNTTYIVENSDCLMLSDIEIRDTNVLRLDDEESDDEHQHRVRTNRNAKNLLETSQSRSVIMDGPTLDPRLLPVIGDSSEDEELSTPMVEVINGTWNNSGFTVATTSPQKADKDQDAKNHNNHNKKDETSRITRKQNPSKETTDLNRKNNNTGAVHKTTSCNKPAGKSTKIFDIPPTSSHPSTTKHSSLTTNSGEEDKQENGTKQPRMSSTRNMLTAAASAKATQPEKITKKLKPPSKNQEIMDKIKASIEADKKAKKEAKSNVITNIPPALSPIATDATTPSQVQSNPPQVNVAEPKEKSTKTKTENMEKVPTNNSDAIKSVKKRAKAVVDSVAKVPKKTAVATAVPTVPAQTSRVSSSQKAALTQKTKDFTATLRAPLKQRQQQQAITAVVVQPEKEQISEICQLESKHKEELLEVQRKFSEEVSAIKSTHELEVQKQRDEFAVERQSLADQVKSEQEIKQSACSALEMRISELEIEKEVLIVEKNRLEDALSKEDENERISKLIAEVNSLKYDLEYKSQLLNELRTKNQELQFAVDTIPEKETENQKLCHRVGDLKMDLNQQREIQKVLTQQLEEAQRKIKQNKLAHDSLVKENEIMHFRLDEMANEGAASPSSLSYTTANDSNNSSVTPVNFRASADRPNSGGTGRPNSTSYYPTRNAHTPPRNGDAMAKSWDSSSSAQDSLLSLYKEQGHKRVLNTPTKIYAPDGTYEATDTPVARNDEKNSAVRKVDLNAEDHENSSSLHATNGNERTHTTVEETIIE